MATVQLRLGLNRFTLPLRARARKLAEGLHGGAHRANHKGSGVEFAGHRPYSAGDDLRHLDRHALLRHGRLMIREYHTDTERPLHLLVDATASMSYRDQETDPSKLERALLLAAALAHLARRRGDPVGLTWVGGADGHAFIPPRGGAEHFERIIWQLETLEQGARSAPEGPSTLWAHSLAETTARLPRAADVFVLSDFLDFDAHLSSLLAGLNTYRRNVVALQLLAPAEVSFPFVGPQRLLDPESDYEVETDGQSARETYLAALAQITQLVHRTLSAGGGRLVRLPTDLPAERALAEALAP